MSNKIIGYKIKNNNTPLFIIGLTLIGVVIFFLWFGSIDSATDNTNQAKEPKAQRASGLKPEPRVEKVVEKVVEKIEPKEETTIKAVPQGIKEVVENGASPMPVRAEVIKQSISRQLEDNQPKEFASSFNIGDTVYYYTLVKILEGAKKIEHVWVTPSGERYFGIDLTLRGEIGSTWSQITLPPGAKGKWEVKTVVEGKYVKGLTFFVQ